LRETASCEVPDGDEARGVLEVVVVDWCYVNGNAGATLIGEFDAACDDVDVQALEDLVRSAWLLLQSNLDLIEWVVCLIASWSPDEIDPDAVMACVEPTLTEASDVSGMSIYLVCQFLDRFGEISDKTGGAYSFDTPAPDGNFGPVLAAGRPAWIDFVDDFVNGTDAERLCAVIQAASIILHELLHVCVGSEEGEPGFHLHAREAPCEWDDVRLMKDAFEWAITQRYTCVADVDGCRRASLDSSFLDKVL
jgi:hypothetical protein